MVRATTMVIARGMKMGVQTDRLKEVFTMGYEKIEKIINALTIIQDICKTRPCDMCPFKTSDGECGISNKNPVWWDINSFDDWRAFK